MCIFLSNDIWDTKETSSCSLNCHLQKLFISVDGQGREPVLVTLFVLMYVCSDTGTVDLVLNGVNWKHFICSLVMSSIANRGTGFHHSCSDDVS